MTRIPLSHSIFLANTIPPTPHTHISCDYYRRYIISDKDTIVKKNGSLSVSKKGIQLYSRKESYEKSICV